VIASRWKKVLADFWGNKIRTILTIVTIAVGTFAVGFNNNMAMYMSESMDSDFLSANPSEAFVYAYPMTDDSVRAALQVPGVNAAEGRSISGSQIVRPGGDKVSIQFTAVKNPDSLTVNILKPAAGQDSIPTLVDRSVLIDSSATPLGYRPGDTIAIELDDGTIRELRLAGYLHDATGYPYNLGQPVDAFVNPDTMEWLGGPADFDALAISVAERPTDAKHVTEVAQAVADRIKHTGATVNYVSVYQPGHHFAYSQARAMFFILGVLGWLTVLLSMILVVNTITALMTQQARQIGIMKATGGGTSQILGMYLVLILIFGAFALVIAVPLANRAAQTIGDGMAAYLNFFPATYRGYASTLWQQGIVAFIVPLLAAIWPLYNSLHVTVREALSDYGVSSKIRSKEGHVSRAALLLPRPIRLSLRNAFRRRLRLALTLFTLVLAGALFIAVYNLWASFDRTIGEISRYILADINIGFDHSYRLDKVAPLAESIPGVKGAEGWLEYGGTLVVPGEEAGRQILFVAPPSSSTLIDPVIATGRWLTAADQNGVVIGNQFQSVMPGTKVGDSLTIKIDGTETTWRIVGIYTIVGNVNPPLLYVNYEYLSRLIGRPDQVQSLRILTTGHDISSQKSVNAPLQALFARRGIRITSTQLGANFVAQQKGTTDIFVYFMLVMAVLIAAVGGLGLAGTMSINVLERMREIGMLRAIGASNGDIQGIVITEGIVIALLSWLASIILSLPITIVLTTGVGLAPLTAPMPPVFGYSGIVVWLLGILVIGTLASALPARRASSLTVRDTLAYE
jgi:putative ABC transport system permease protein